MVRQTPLLCALATVMSTASVQSAAIPLRMYRFHHASLSGGEIVEAQPVHLVLQPSVVVSTDLEDPSSQRSMRLRETTLWPGDHGILVLRDHPGWKLVASHPRMVLTSVAPALGILLRSSDRPLRDVVVRRTDAQQHAILNRVEGCVGYTTRPQRRPRRVALHIAATVTTCQQRAAQIWASVACGRGFQATLVPTIVRRAAAFVIDARVAVPPGRCTVTLHLAATVDGEWTGSCPSHGDGFQNSRSLTAWWMPAPEERRPAILLAAAGAVRSDCRIVQRRVTAPDRRADA